MTDARRVYQRISVKIPVEIFNKNKPTTQGTAGEILNISVGGAFIECPINFEIGQIIQIHIHFRETQVLEAQVTEEDPELANSVPVDAPEESVVRWITHAAKDGFGIQFHNLNSDKQKFLDKLIGYYNTLARAGVSF